MPELVLAVPADDPLQFRVIDVRKRILEDGRFTARLAVGGLREDVRPSLCGGEQLLHVPEIEPFEEGHARSMTI